MAKSNAPRTRKRAGKVVVSETEEKENDTNTEGTEEEDVPTKNTETAGEQEEAKVEQACQMDSSDPVGVEQGGTPTVTMTWETEENKEGESKGFCVFVGNLNNSKKYGEVKDSLARYFMTQSLLVQDIKLDGSRKYAYVEFASEMDLTKALTLDGAMILERPVRITKPENKDVEKDQPEDSRDCHMDAPDPVSGEQDGTPTVTVTWETKEKKEGEVVNGKRKAESADESSPSKKAKTINDGFCLYVGNLNDSKSYEEVNNSLTSYFMTQSLMVQCIRLDRSRKFAYVDLASETDLTKGLTLDGEMMLEKPMRIAKAKVKIVGKVKAKAKKSKKDKRVAKDARCLFLKNVPYTATKEDILNIFKKAVAVRFPNGTEGPSHGIAFVEFQDQTTAEKVYKKKQGTKMQDRVLIVELVGEKSAYKAKKSPATVEAPPSTTLFVNNLSYNVKEEQLRKVFNKAVNINLPQNKGKSKGFAFVEFGNVKDAKKALESSQKTEICKRAIRVEFSEVREKSANEKVVFLSKTLIVMGLAEKTTEETLKSAFEGAITARVPINKLTGVSKGFGFLDFDNEEECKAAKDAMEDCEIDGSQVTVAYARSKVEGGSQQGDSGGSVGGSPGRPVNRGSFRGARGSRGGRGRGAGPAMKAQRGAKGGKNKG